MTITKLSCLSMWLVACASLDSEPPGTLVRAGTGGIVTDGDVTLVIPPGALAEDTVIDIAPDPDTPVAEADGFVAAGAGFRFSPPGTQFALASTAILTMPYDPAALAAQGLDGRTLELAYYDEELGRYFSIGGEADPASGTITARVEHFTLYVAMAASLVPGNNPPTIAPQSPIPALIRANAPVYLRALIRDYDLGGSIAGARLFYRSSSSDPFTSVLMRPETTLDQFGAQIPASAVIAGPTTTDLEYYFVATDNLGAVRQSAAPIAVDIGRTYTPGSLVMTPSTPAIAAGFERLFAVNGKDETLATFALVPEVAGATNDIGETSIGTTGVTFRARTVGAGNVTAGFGAESATLPVTVFNGALDRIAILDDDGNELDGALVVKEGQRVQLDALGYDAYGNTILVNPQWTHDAEIGFVSPSGLVDALDGHDSGRVVATVGDVEGSEWLDVTQRVWETQVVLGEDMGVNTLFSKLASRNGVPYVYYAELYSGGRTFRVRHQEGSTWVDDGVPSFDSTEPTSSIAIGAGTSRLQVAWTEGSHVYSAHLEGVTWVRDGGVLEVDPDNGLAFGHSGHQLDIAFDGDTPYLAWHESTPFGLSVHVRRWNGTSWALVGGQVQAPSDDAFNPAIAILDGVPYVAYESTVGVHQIYVRRWNGTVWEQLGGSLNLYPSAMGVLPDLDVVDGRPTAAFRNDLGGGFSPAYIVEWNGASWAQIDPGGIFTPPFTFNYAYALAVDGDVLYVAWLELQPGASSFRRRTMHRNPRTGTWTDLGTWLGLYPSAEISLTIAGTTPYMATAEEGGLVDRIHILGLH